MDVSSKVEVVWADNSKTIILPQVRPCQAQTAQLRRRGWKPGCPLRSGTRGRALILRVRRFLVGNRVPGEA